MNANQEEFIAYLSGVMLVALALIGASIFVGHFLGKRRTPPQFQWWPVIVGAALAAYSAFNSVQSELQSHQVDGASSSDQVAQPIVEVVVVRGNVANDLPAALPDPIIDQLRSAFNSDAEITARRMGRKIRELQTTLHPLRTRAGKTVLQSQSRTDGSLFLVQFSGVAEGNSTTVVCALRSAGSISVVTPECGRKVNEVFGEFPDPLIVRTQPNG